MQHTASESPIPRSILPSLGIVVARVSSVRVYGRFAWQPWRIVAARTRRWIEGCSKLVQEAVVWHANSVLKLQRPSLLLRVLYPYTSGTGCA